MIRDLLLPELIARFPERGFQMQNSGNTLGFFPAAHSEVGNLYIAGDGDEATLFIGDLTHLHFDFESGEADPEKRVSNNVLDFLDELFTDRILIWKSRTKGGDGVMPLEAATVYSAIDPNDLTYVWSGPIKNPKRGDAG